MQNEKLERAVKTLKYDKMIIRGFFFFLTMWCNVGFTVRRIAKNVEYTFFEFVGNL